MFCLNCGQELIDGAAFCTNCGTAVSAAETVEKADNQAVEAEVVVSSEEVVEDVDVVEATIEDVDVDLDSDDAAEVAEDADAYVTEVANAVTGGIAPEYEQMVESLEAAVQANEEAIRPIVEHAEAEAAVKAQAEQAAQQYQSTSSAAGASGWSRSGGRRSCGRCCRCRCCGSTGFAGVTGAGAAARCSASRLHDAVLSAGRFAERTLQQPAVLRAECLWAEHR